MSAEDEKSLIEIRKSIIEIGFHCGQSAHFGGGLSTVELLYILYKEFLNTSPEKTYDPARDIFVLSKGHGVLGLYGVLHFFGFIPSVFYEIEKSHVILINTCLFISAPAP